MRHHSLVAELGAAVRAERHDAGLDAPAAAPSVLDRRSSLVDVER